MSPPIVSPSVRWTAFDVGYGVPATWASPGVTPSSTGSTGSSGGTPSQCAGGRTVCAAQGYCCGGGSYNCVGGRNESCSVIGSCDLYGSTGQLCRCCPI